MRPFGAAVHLRKGTVNLKLVRWMVIGSVPAAFLGAYLLHVLGNAKSAQLNIERVLGAALLLGASAMLLRYMLDRDEFLSPYGIRALSRYHRQHPYVLSVDGVEHRVDYEAAESSTGLFGGNSNWRGPVWFPVNYLLIESLQKFHHFYGDDLKVECPTGSGTRLTLWQIAVDIARRLTRIFLRDANGRRPVFGGTELFQQDANWRDLVPFYEHFHAEDGRGLGASHQTGWTALIAKLIQQNGEPESAGHHERLSDAHAGSAARSAPVQK